MQEPIFIHWDYYDQVAEADRPYGYEEMAALCRAAKTAGVAALNFRAEGAGMAWVPNPVRPLFARHEPGRALPWADFSRVPSPPGDREMRLRVAGHFRRIYEQCGDPLETAARAARDEGMRLNVYICPYDQYWPGVPDTLVEQHPDRCIASRDGHRRLAVPSLAYPENVEWLLAYYDAVLAHDVADLIVYSGSHSWYAYPTDVPDDWFGFEEPAAESYLAETGIDPHREGFDIDDYYRHYGTFWTRFLEELARRQQARGHRLVVGKDLGPWQIYLPWNAGKLMTTWRHENDWKTWTGWGNVDLCVGHQVNMWEYERWPGNRLPYMPGDPDRPPYLHVEDVYGPGSSRAFKLYSFLTLHPDRAALELPLAGRGTREGGYDGLMIRETANFEFELGWDALAGLRQ